MCSLQNETKILFRFQNRKDMESQRCSGTTKTGKGCSRNAKVDGLCTQHAKMAGTVDGGEPVEVKPVMTITFGDVAENHARMQQIGEMADSGFAVAELIQAADNFGKHESNLEIIDLRQALPEELQEEAAEACILILRGGAQLLLEGTGMTIDDLLTEHVALTWDKKAFMRGRVVNKHARYNLCYSNEPQEPDYEAGKGRIVDWDSVPLLKHVRSVLPKFIGPKAVDLNAEGNLYFDPSKCGIGFHGDAERKKVVAIRLGGTMPLHYQWFRNSKPVGNRIKLSLDHGDLYIMSEKAVGHDWLKKKTLTLRHAAGAEKFLTI